MSRRLIRIALVLVLAGGGLLACAHRSGNDAPKYPPRRPNCALMIFHGDTPEVPAWDDLGRVEVICHIDDPESTCFARMRAEACRMGGDIIYHLPRKVWRPREEAQGFRGKVAHTRAAVPDRTPPSPVKDPALFPPPASPEEAAGPVVPLTGPGAPVFTPAPSDAGSSRDAAADQ